jgi:hypothetical protein
MSVLITVFFSVLFNNLLAYSTKNLLKCLQKKKTKKCDRFQLTITEDEVMEKGRIWTELFDSLT